MTESSLTTRDKILQAAIDIFARNGFKSATIRKIAIAAQVNIAAINYHFRDKERLYAEVLEYVFQTAFNRFPPRLHIDETVQPEMQLRGFIRAMFSRLLSREGLAGKGEYGKLIARELLEPTPALEAVLNRFMRPQRDLLLSILAAILKTQPDNPVLLSCTVSIIAQCVYYALAGSVIRRMTYDQILDEDNLDNLAEFVWTFSLGGLENLQRSLKPQLTAD